MRLIDADALLAELNAINAPYRADINNAITNAPTIDIVQCSECKHSYGVFRYCAIDHWVGDADAFCSYGCREDGDDNEID